MAEPIISYLLDTNVLVRFLVGDIKEQQKQALVRFHQAKEGSIRIIITPLVIAETCFVLESFYKKERQKIADVLEVFLSQRWLKVEDREILLGLWKWYKQGRHFVDSFLLSKAEIQENKILTFDQQLKKKSNLRPAQTFFVG